MRIVTPKQCLNFTIVDYGCGDGVVLADVDEKHPSGWRHRNFDAVAIWGRIWRVGSWSWMERPGKCQVRLKQTEYPDWYRGRILK